MDEIQLMPCEVDFHYVFYDSHHCTAHQCICTRTSKASTDVDCAVHGRVKYYPIQKNSTLTNSRVKETKLHDLRFQDTFFF